MWEAVLEHARTCVLTNQMHVYRHHGSQKQGAVVFNVVGEMKGVISDQGQFVSIDNLSEKEIVIPSLFFLSVVITQIMYMFTQCIYYG
jgi:Calmodulin binding protein-like